MTDEKRLIGLTVHSAEAAASTVGVRGSRWVGSTSAVLPGSLSRATVGNSNNIVEIHMSPTFEVLAAAKNALLGLINSRDFLGFQLAQATGSISDDAFEAIAEKYLQTCDWNEDKLADLVEALVHLMGDRVDSDLVSVAFNCELEQAERALRAAAKRLVATSPGSVLVAAR